MSGAIRPNEAKQLKPFLKWAGGKRWLLPRLKEHLPPDFERYVEPFLGGGAVFFGLNPQRAILTDLNRDLVGVYRAIQKDPKNVAKMLERQQELHSSEHYYKMRAGNPTDEIERAVRFLYLNRTCFNGLYRVNKKGEFNVPIGTKSSVIFDDESFDDLATALSRAEIGCADFEDTIDKTVSGDFLYVDPPYTVAHNFNGFVKYNDHIFSWSDQVRLREALGKAATRGVAIVVSNANHESIQELYFGFGSSHQLERHSVIAGPSDRRSKTSELLICVGCQ